jgi:NCAIR mutase (PurE)-related protein
MILIWGGNDTKRHPRGPTEGRNETPLPPADEAGILILPIGDSEGVGWGMRRDELNRLLDDFERGRITRNEMLDLFLSGGFTDLVHTKVDTARRYRTGIPEVVYSRGKTPDELLQITGELVKKNGFALLTRADGEQAEIVRKHFPEAVHHERCAIVTVGEGLPRGGLVSVLTGGTSDIPVAEEAAVTAETFGSNVRRFFDVGVAGLHRLLTFREEIEESNAIIAVAGMEGALASVAGGLFDAPVIGVPTSTGYGASFGGTTPLLAMLNSCAPAVSVVNIDNGFGAGYVASLINRKIVESGSHD